MAKRRPLDRLAELQGEVAAAGERYSEAAYRGKKGREAVNLEVIAPLRDFQAKDPNKLDPDHLATRRRLTADLLAEVEARDLLFEEVRAPGGGGTALIVVDPSIDKELDAALAAKAEANAALREFDKDNREAIAQEEAQERADAFRQAVDADDLDTARRLLNGEEEDAAPLTTDDFQVEEERRTFSEGSHHYERVADREPADAA
jgi:hypothetical protein